MMSSLADLFHAALAILPHVVGKEPAGSEDPNAPRVAACLVWLNNNDSIKEGEPQHVSGALGEALLSLSTLADCKRLVISRDQLSNSGETYAA